MKLFYLFSILFGMSANAAVTGYTCDSLNLSNNQRTYGSSTFIEISEDQLSAQMFSRVVYPGAIKQPTFKLTIADSNDLQALYTSSQSLQDLNISFKLTPNRKAGILKMNDNTFLCEQD